MKSSAAKQRQPFLKDRNMAGAAPGHFGADLLEWGFAPEFFGRFAEKQVSPANDAFLQGLGAVIAQGQRKLLFQDVGLGNADAHVPFRHQRMTGQAFALQNDPALRSMTDVGPRFVERGAVALNVDDADVVQHGGFLDKPLLFSRQSQALGNPQGFGRH